MEKELSPSELTLIDAVLEAFFKSSAWQTTAAFFCEEELAAAKAKVRSGKSFIKFNADWIGCQLLIWTSHYTSEKTMPHFKLTAEGFPETESSHIWELVREVRAEMQQYLQAQDIQIEIPIEPY